MSEEIKPFSVSDLTIAIRSVLESDFERVKVFGEISNYKQHTSGHRYFTLKDEGAQIQCVMWKSRPLRFDPHDGMKVVVSGGLTVYPQRGNYQLDISSMVPAGLGDLYLAFEAMKKKLEEAGYFDSKRKMPLPVLPMKIGVSTSPTGAAVRDIITTIGRRFPAAEIYFRPTLVQGDGSAEDIVAAIEELQARNPDVIIIGRGGGSIEDLWAYNTEIVANAIYNRAIPIVSAVGHETDFTIADFVADVRAATPTAAAELVTPYHALDLASLILDLEKRMGIQIKNRVANYRNEVDKSFGERALRRLKEKVYRSQEKLDDLVNKATRSILIKLKYEKQSIDAVHLRIKALHPMSPVERGFAAIRGKGKFLKANQSALDYSEIEIIRKNETFTAKPIGKKLFE